MPCNWYCQCRSDTLSYMEDMPKTIHTNRQDSASDTFLQKGKEIDLHNSGSKLSFCTTGTTKYSWDTPPNSFRLGLVCDMYRRDTSIGTDPGNRLHSGRTDSSIYLCISDRDTRRPSTSVVLPTHILSYDTLLSMSWHQAADRIHWHNSNNKSCLGSWHNLHRNLYSCLAQRTCQKDRCWCSHHGKGNQHGSLCSWTMKIGRLCMNRCTLCKLQTANSRNSRHHMTPHIFYPSRAILKHSSNSPPQINRLGMAHDIFNIPCWANKCLSDSYRCIFLDAGDHRCKSDMSVSLSKQDMVVNSTDRPKTDYKFHCHTVQHTNCWLDSGCRDTDTIDRRWCWDISYSYSDRTGTLSGSHSTHQDTMSDT